MSDPSAQPVRIAVFVPDLADRPDRRAAVALANALVGDGRPVDLVAPMGGGALRATLDPAIGQIDLAKRHAATSPLALARCLAERRPALLVVPETVLRVARLAVWLARSGARVVVLGGEGVDGDLAAIRAAAPRWG